MLLPERRERIKFVQLNSVFLFLRSVGGWKLLTEVQQKKIKKKNFFSDIARINATMDFYNNDYAMHIV